MNKKGQEEIVGFAVIIIIVAVIMLFLLSFYIRGGNSESVDSFEAESFVSSLMHFTTSCESNLGYNDIQRLIYECSRERNCLNGQSSCEILNSEIREIVEKSWQVGEDRPIRGYSLVIGESGSETEVISIVEGNQTANFKGSFHDFVIDGERIEVNFRAYYAE